MKSGKHISAIVLAAILASMAFAGCTGAKPEESASSSQAGGTDDPASTSQEKLLEGVSYPIQGNIKLTYASAEEAQVTANAKNLGETAFGKAWQEATGISLEIRHPSGADGMNLMFASGDLPDIIEYNFSGYAGGPVKAIKDQIIEPLDSLLDENAPDLKAVLDGNDLYRKSITSADGHIVGFPFIRGDKILLTSAGLMLREDWKTDLGLNTPKTPEQLYTLLQAFRTEKQATVPLSLAYSDIKRFIFNEGVLTSPYGIPRATFYQDGGTVKFGYNQPGMKDLYGFLNKLYTEGLLDPNFATLDGNTKNANIMNGLSGMTIGSLAGGMGNYLQTMKPKDAAYDLSGVGSLVKNPEDRPMSGHYDNPVTGLMSVITPNCKNKEAAAQFLNYGYTDAGHLLFNFGIEGESYAIADGKPVFSQRITNNSEGLTMQLALAQYARSWAGDSFVQDPAYILQYAPLPQQKGALDAWTSTDASTYCMPPVSIAEADSAEYSKLYSDLDTYIDEMAIKFITGAESLDKFETDYLPTIENLGIGRILELQQAAFQEFGSR